MLYSKAVKSRELARFQIYLVTLEARGGHGAQAYATSVIFPRIFMYLHNSILMYYMTWSM